MNHDILDYGIGMSEWPRHLCVAWGILVKVCTILQVRATVYVGGGARPPRGRSLVEVAVRRNLLDLGELPLAVAERADRARLQPARDAVEVEDVAAAAPRDRVAGVVGEAGVGLRLDGRLVQLVAANGARVCARERNKRGV